jgi:1,5-anhydro-D-fructose reductase (1,5-anhydro-D-mannitol-forming)
VNNASTAPTIQWGILGCGDVTEKKSGPAFSRVPGSKLVAVMRRDAAKAEDYARRHGVPKWSTNADEILQDPDVHAIYIATPPGSHHELALLCAAVGKPCYVEKPMARHAWECREMNAAFAAAGQPLFVAYYRRGLPGFRWIREQLAAGTWGRLLDVRYRYSGTQMRRPDFSHHWRFDPAVSGGGLLWDLGSHALDLFAFWFGPLRLVGGRVQPWQNQGPCEESAAATLVNPDGVSLSASWNFRSPLHEDQFVLTCEEAEITGSVFGSHDFRVSRSKDARETISFALPEHIQEPLITNIVETLHGRGIPWSTGETALPTNQLIDEIAGLTPAQAAHS